MTNTVVRPLGYTGNVQELVVEEIATIDVRAYLWGGGGGGGGRDSAPGGVGSGGGFAQVDFTIGYGDIVRIAVGEGGGPGSSGVTGQGAGWAGASYTIGPVFDTISASSSPPVYPQFNANYCTFLNRYGVWEANTRTRDFDRSYTVSFPLTGLYTFTASADNGAVVYLDGIALFSATSFGNTFEQPVQVTAGNHIVRIRATNTGGPGAVALTISSGSSYSGGRGGNAGGRGTSGAGGGGGGATVLSVNNTVIAVAGGGGGGGGGGNGPHGDPAPGTRGQSTTSSAGQNGVNKNGDGGGAGGGGGGYYGGNGGEAPGGDQGGGAGAYGTSWSSNGPSSSATTTLPAGATYPYYNTQRGRGGQGGAVVGYPPSAGSTGYAVLEFTVNGISIKHNGSFVPVINQYIKVNGQWKLVTNTFIKRPGFSIFGFQFPSVWRPILGSYSPVFNANSAVFGVNSREADGDAGQGGGGGDCCVVSTAFAESGIWNSQQKDELVAWCEDKLHNHALGECFRRGYQVVGSKALIIINTQIGKSYAKWSFDNGTRMVRGKSFSWWSIPNSLLWISAFMLVGAVVTTNYANRCWKSKYKEKK